MDPAGGRDKFHQDYGRALVPASKLRLGLALVLAFSLFASSLARVGSECK